MAADVAKRSSVISHTAFGRATGTLAPEAVGSRRSGRHSSLSSASPMSPMGGMSPMGRGRTCSSATIFCGNEIRQLGRFSDPEERNGSSITLEDTFVELFLKGVKSTRTLSQDLERAYVEDAFLSSQQLRCQTIPDPPGWDPMLASHSRGSLMSNDEGRGRRAGSGEAEGDGEEEEEKWAKLGLESMVQDYLKDHLAPLRAIAAPDLPPAEPRGVGVEASSSSSPSSCDWQARFFVECLERGVDFGKLSPYVVMAQRCVGSRRVASVADGARTGVVLQPGELFFSQVIASVAGERFVRRWPHGDWLFETKGEERVLAKAEHLEVGPWWYRSVCTDLIEVRRVPSHGNAARAGFVVCPGEVCVVSLRCRVDGRRYLLLADGRGWVFESLLGDEIGDDTLVLVECDAQPQKHKDGSRGDSKALQTGCWMYQVLDQNVLALGSKLFGVVLEPGEQVLVNARISASGLAKCEVSYEEKAFRCTDRRWLRLQSGRGWIPNVDESGTPLVRFVRGEDLNLEFVSSAISGASNRTSHRTSAVSMYGFVSEEPRADVWQKGIV
eukprot:CAMPEP_0115190322 /NCGR_PEP_ID=MMETSP0270-20121206/11966_1 /TAXON_ID=71861 /ORGANISM="Scrippsiella trochoidea, Strain CCMP3099" /LENGTH=554 /DNA_ID=CAMNT_0002603531 /DNA_START=57 /DNA_END=1721 /DNA_ORIENTATION=+